MLNKGTGGFSLLEIMIAIAFFAIAIISLMGAYSHGIFADLYLDRGAIAVNLAQERLEGLKRGNYASIAVGTVTENPVIGFRLFRRRTRVTEAAANPNSRYKTVAITVSWLMKGIWQNYNLTTYIANY